MIKIHQISFKILLRDKFNFNVTDNLLAIIRIKELREMSIDSEDFFVKIFEFTFLGRHYSVTSLDGRQA